MVKKASKVKKLQPLKGKKPITAKMKRPAIVLATSPHATKLHKPKKIALHHTPVHPTKPPKHALSKKTIW